jgi:hypothetical protein
MENKFSFPVISYESLSMGILFFEVINMARVKKDPSTAGVSAASVKGNAGPNVEGDGGGKRNSQNNQYKRK